MSQTVTTKARHKAHSTAIKTTGQRNIVINIQNQVETPHARAIKHARNFPQPVPYVVPPIVNASPRQQDQVYSPPPLPPPAMAGTVATDFESLPPQSTYAESIGSVAEGSDDATASQDPSNTRDYGGYLASGLESLGKGALGAARGLGGALVGSFADENARRYARERAAQFYEFPEEPALAPRDHESEGEAPQNVYYDDQPHQRAYDAANRLRNLNRQQAVQAGVRNTQREIDTEIQEDRPVPQEQVQQLQNLGAPVPDIAGLIQQALNERFPDGLTPQRGERGPAGPPGESIRGEPGQSIRGPPGPSIRGERGEQGNPGRAPTATELVAAANEYVRSQGGIEAFRGPAGASVQGEAGAPGRAPTQAEIRQAVDAFMAEHGQHFVGAQGAQGPQGIPGADSTVPGPPGVTRPPNDEEMGASIADYVQRFPNRFLGRTGPPGPASTVPGPPPSDADISRVMQRVVETNPDRFRGQQGIAGTVNYTNIDQMIGRRMQNFAGQVPGASSEGSADRFDDASSEAGTSEASFRTARSNASTSFYTAGGGSMSARQAGTSGTRFHSAMPGSARSQISEQGSVRQRSRSPPDNQMVDSDEESTADSVVDPSTLPQRMHPTQPGVVQYEISPGRYVQTSHRQFREMQQRFRGRAADRAVSSRR